MEKTDCVNTLLPIITNEERIERNKKKQQNYDKVYYAKNKEKHREKITCECGSTISRSSMSQHLKTEKHLNYVSGLNTKR